MEEFPQKKRESGVSRIVGVEDDAEKGILEFFAQQFRKGERSLIETEHSEELDEMIPNINRYMGEFLLKYGVDSIDISREGLHLIDKEKLSLEQRAMVEKIGEVRIGQHYAGTHHIAMFRKYEGGHKIEFLQTLVHEMIHMNSFQSMQRIEAKEVESVSMVRTRESGEREEVELAFRRIGFRARTNKSNGWAFYDLDEAMVTELMMRFDWEYFGSIEALREEYKRRQGVIDAAEKHHKENSEDGVRDIKREVASIEVGNRDQDGKIRVAVGVYSYKKERAELNKIIDKLYIRNKAQFSSREDVFKLFADGVLTGRLLPIARLIEKTYGKGSFRELGEKTIQEG